jgi:hypothetical protein
LKFILNLLGGISKKWTYVSCAARCYAFLYAIGVPAQKWRKTLDFINEQLTKPCLSTKNGTQNDKICQCRAAIFVTCGLHQQKLSHQIENGELTLPVLSFDR